MRHIYAIGIKFIIVTTIILSILGIFSNASIASLLVMSVIITAISYAIGDLFILHQVGNVIATIVDLGIYFISVWALTGMFIGMETGILLASLAATYFLTLAEPLFHVYVIERVFGIEDDRVIISNVQFQTEASEEKIVQFDDLKKESNNNRQSHRLNAKDDDPDDMD